MNKSINKSFILLTAFLLPIASSALSFCMEPSVSFLMTPYKPEAPYCVNLYTNTHTCDDWEINNYYDELDNYRFEVNQFIEALNNYVDEASEYARCRANEIE